MGQPTTPSPEERTERLTFAQQIIAAVENDEEGPLALPDLSSAGNQKSRIDQLKRWWQEVDLRIFQLAQGWCDSSQALELACALLAKHVPPALLATGIIDRLRHGDIPSQEELDAACGTAAGDEPPVLDPPSLP